MESSNAPNPAVVPLSTHMSVFCVYTKSHMCLCVCICMHVCVCVSELWAPYGVGVLHPTVVSCWSSIIMAAFDLG